VAEGVSTFKGIPYGASTSGLNRFMPPNKPGSWAGVRNACDYGPMAMQWWRPSLKQMIPTDFGRLYKGIFPSAPYRMSEDCLVLNVWSPELGEENNLPVMVWLHGGGFSNGAGDWRWADGTNLARKNGVVVVSLNHRLNVFGHLHLRDIGGTKYSDSGNAGMLDVVAALRWIQDNIASFGGDPGNITIFGQSGGGSKVSALMAMPSSQGLFHKSIQMSGPCLKVLPREEATRTATQVMRQLGFHHSDVDRLQHVPAQQLLKAAEIVANRRGGDIWRNGAWIDVFSPVVDGRSLTRHPFDPTAPEISARIPMLLGNTGDESRTTAAACLKTLDEEGMHAHLNGMGIDSVQADRLIRAYRSSRPSATPADVLCAIISDLEFRMDVIITAERKSALRDASVYMYLFTCESPAFDGKYKSFHGFDIPFVFDNIDSAPELWGQCIDPRSYELAARMSKAWAEFARTGTPNHPGLPEWKPYRVGERATMVLNYSCELVNDPRREDRLAFEQWNSRT